MTGDSSATMDMLVLTPVKLYWQRTFTGKLHDTRSRTKA